VRIGRQVGLHFAIVIGSRVPIGFARQTGGRTGVKVAFRLPFGVATETTSGTVPGTVPTAVSGRSALTTLNGSKVNWLRYLTRFWPA
jgi:hypothetical protein